MALFRVRKSDFQSNLNAKNHPSWTPTFGNDGGGGPATFTAVRNYYYQIGKLVYFTFEVTITASGGALGRMTVTLPFTPAYTGDIVIATGRETAVTGRQLFGFWDDSQNYLAVHAYNAVNGGTTIFTTNYNHLVTGAFRIA